MRKKQLGHSIARCLGAAALAGAIALAAAPAQALAECTQFWLPARYSANGSRYVGRDEDGGYRYVKAYGIEPSHDGTTYYSDEGSFEWTSSKTSYRYSYVRDTEDMWDGSDNAYSANGVNEKGVSASATLSTAMNADIGAIDPNENAGIGEYNYVSVILGESATAREGVELVGSLIDEYGAYTCDQLTISDPNESWIMIVLSGHQWVAFRLPDDQASVNPNMSNLRFTVDLDDEATCLHSAAVVSLPYEAGLLKTFADGSPDLAATYGTGDDEQGAGQNTRYGQGLAYFKAALDPADYTLGERGITSIDEPQLFFTPGRGDWTTFEVLRALATRGEGTNLDANVNPTYHAIGNNWQMEGHVFEIRSGLSADVATIQWLALSRTEFSVAIPLYSALITEASPYFGTTATSSDHGDYYGDTVEQAMEEEPENNLDYVFMDINTLCYNNRATTAAGMRGYLDAIQHELIAQNEQVDALIRAASPEERTRLANEAQLGAVRAVYTKAKAALDEERSFLNEGGEGQFVPSDYDAAAGTLKTPLAYAAAVVAPTITAQPVSASYVQGAAAADLTVAAEAGDGVGTLAYEWFAVAADGTVASTGVTGASLPVSTEAVGASTYFCRVTNAAGLYVDSEQATVSVTAPAAQQQETQQSGPKTQVPRSAGDTRGKSGVPQTGDASAAPGALACAGAAAAVLGVVGVSTARSASRRRE